MGSYGSGDLKSSHQPNQTPSLQLDRRNPAGADHGSGTLYLMLSFEITGTVIEWRGPAPFYFLPTPQEVTEEIELYKRELSYGWGVIPAKVTIGQITIATSLIPRDGSFFIPLKDAIRRPNQIQPGDEVSLLLEL